MNREWTGELREESSPISFKSQVKTSIFKSFLLIDSYFCIMFTDGQFHFQVWVTYIVFLSNGIFRSKRRGRFLFLAWTTLFNNVLLYVCLRMVSFSIELRFGLLILSFYPMGSFVLRV